MNPLSPSFLQPLLPNKRVRRRFRQRHLASIACTAICWGLLQTAAWGLFPDFRGTGRPGNHGSGASRSNCPVAENAPAFTLLVPEEAQYGGYTTKANPSVWAYVPYMLGADSSITFSLEDGSGTIIYTTFYDLNHEPGILKLDLPSSVNLEIGRSYKWYLMIHCNDPERRDVADWASGWIERVADPVIDDMSDLNQLSLVEQSNAYANQLIWYDALNILAEGRLASPNNRQIREAWTNLLSLPSVRLDAFSTQAIRNCCILSESSEDQ